MARLIGDAYFNVYPNTDDFVPKLQEAVSKATSVVKGKVPVKPELDQAAMALVQAQLKNLAGKINLGIAIDPAEAAKIAAEMRAIGEAASKGAQFPIHSFIDPAQLAAEAVAIRQALSQAYAPIEVKPSVSNKDLGDALMAIHTFYQMNPAKIPVNPQANVAGEAAFVAATKAYMDAHPIPIKFDIGAAALLALASIRSAFSGFAAVQMPDFASAIAGALTYKAALASLSATMDGIVARNLAVNALVKQGTGIWVQFLNFANAGWANMGVKITLFAGLLNNILPKFLSTVSVGHLLIDWIVEFAAVLGPAILAVGAFGLAIAPVASDAVMRFQEMQQAASALGVQIGVLNYNARGAVGPMQALQNSLQPVMWELTGDAIAVMTAKTGVFQSVVKSMSTVVEDLAARMTAAFTSQGFSDFMKNGALDAQRFGTIIGNLGGAFGNIVKAVPGYAAIIEQAFVVLTSAIEKVTSLTIPLMNIVMAFHGFILYVGLAATAGVALVTWLVNGAARMLTFAAAATDLDAILLTMMYAWDGLSAAVVAFGKNMMALALNPWVIAIAALGLAVYTMVVNWNAASASVQQFTSHITTLIGTMAGGQALQEIPTALGQLNAALVQAASPAAYQQIQASWMSMGNTGNAFAKDMRAVGSQLKQAFSSSWLDPSFFTHLGDAMKSFVRSSGAGVAYQVQANIQNIQAAFNQLMAQDRNLLIVAGQLMQGMVKIPGTMTSVTTATFSWAQALGILNAAGVQASDSLQTMEIKVAGFLQGWSQFGLSATQIGNSVNALALQAEMGQTAIQKLTSAYSNFIAIGTTGTTAFVSFGTGLGTLASALSSANASGVTFTDHLGQFEVRGTAAGAAMNGLSQASLNVRGAFAQEVTNAQNLYNALLTMSSVSAQGAHGQDILAQSMKDMVASMLPLAQNSPTALAMLSQLAQVAGGPATDSFKALSQWVGNIKNPMADLNKQEQGLAIASSNLYQDTINLAGAMNQTLTTAISNAILAAKNGPQALNALATSMNNFATGVKGSSFGQMETDLAKAIPTLELMTGSAATAKAQFLAMAGALHIDSQTANELWAAATKVAPNLDAAAKAAQAFTTYTNQNKTSLANLTSELGMSATYFNQVWDAITKENQALIGNAKQADTTKNAFISFAQNGLHLTSGEATKLWQTAQAQQLTSLASKAGTTESAFAAFAKNGLNLTDAQAQQLWSTLRMQYLDTLVQKGNSAESTFKTLAEQGFNLSDTQAQALWNTLKQQYLDTLATKAGETKDAFVKTAAEFGVASDAAKKLWDQLNAIPKVIPVLVSIGVQISQAQGSGATGAGGLSNSVIAQLGASLGAEGGGVVGVSIPHFAPGGTVPAKAGSPAGKDSQLIVAAPGELVIPTSHAPMFGPQARAAGIPGFGSGGTIPYSYGIGGFTMNTTGIAGQGGMPLLTQYQGNTLIQLLQQLVKLNSQMPYTYAQALTQANGNGVRRGYFATSG